MDNPYTEFEFLTGLQYGDNEYIGIVVNSDNHLITFYDLEALPSIEAQKYLLQLGDVWWWGEQSTDTHRCIPTHRDVTLQILPENPGNQRH